jgi:hypothetical protein
MGLLLAAWREGRDAPPDRWWSYPVEPALAGAALAAAPPPRPRPTLQTGVAILAVALAIDVSAAPLAQLAPIAPEPGAHAAVSGLYDFTDGCDVFAAYAPASWTVSATATDGWFV